MLLYENHRSGTPVYALAFAPDGSALATGGKDGSLVVTPDGTVEVAAHPVSEVVDTTGAGDLYAAGFLYGFTHGRSLGDCGRLGSLAAAEVIAHVGARPNVPLARLTA